MKRPPAGHAAAGFSAIWALFTEVLPKAKTFEPDELREIALKLDLPEGSLVNGSGIKFTNFDWPDDPKDAGQNLRASIGVWQWTKTGNEEVFPPGLATQPPTWCLCRIGANVDSCPAVNVRHAARGRRA